MSWLGDFPVGFTAVPCMFTTHGGNGAPIAPLSGFENADVRIYKNGSATERTSQNGVTMTSPFDAITGLHCLTIDTTDNTDAGFWAAGSTYTLVLSPDETVDGQAVVKVIGQFSIASNTSITAIKAKTDSLTFTVAGQADVNIQYVNDVQVNGNGQPGTTWGP